MNIHGHCYVLPLAAVGPAPMASSVLAATNTNLSQINPSQIPSAMASNLNAISGGSNGGGGINNALSSNTSAGATYDGLPVFQYSSFPHGNQNTKYLLGAHNILPTNFQQQRQQQFNSNSQHMAPAFHHMHHPNLLTIPSYQTNNLATHASSLTSAAAFHPLFASTSFQPQSTSNFSNLSNFASQQQSLVATKNVQQLATIHPTHETTIHTATGQTCNSGGRGLSEVMASSQAQTNSSQVQNNHDHPVTSSQQTIQQQASFNHSIVQPHHSVHSPHFYNPFFTNTSSILPAAAPSMIPKAPLLRTPIIGKVS